MPIIKQIEIACKITRSTANAIKIYVEAPGGAKEVWIPKSQISDEVEENGQTTAIFIPEWLAEREGIV